MTAVAAFAIDAIMSVIFEVTRDAVGRHRVAEWIVGVAVAAGQQSVPAQQGEVGVTGVIETRVFPARRAVAISAVIATAAFMRIVFGMASETVDRCTNECLVLVTAITRRLGVMTHERPAGRVVVEISIFPAKR